MREVLTTIGELFGAALVALGAWMLAPFLGVVLAGLLIGAVSYVASL